MAPAGVPEPILKKLENAVYQATKEQKFKEIMKKMYMAPEWKTSDEFTQNVRSSLISYRVLLNDLSMLKKN